MTQGTNHVRVVWLLLITVCSCLFAFIQPKGTGARLLRLLLLTAHAKPACNERANRVHPSPQPLEVLARAESPQELGLADPAGPWNYEGRSGSTSDFTTVLSQSQVKEI